MYSMKTRLPRLGVWFMVLSLLLVPHMVLAQEMVTVQLESVDGSTVAGTATLSASEGGTNVTLDVDGLPSDAGARATLHAGTCANPSASFAALPDLQADAAGAATATGSVLFRGTERVDLATLTDGEHVIIIQIEQGVACGTIPQVSDASTAPTTLPETGRVASALIFVGAGILGLCFVAAGVLLRYRAQSLRYL